MAPAGLHGVMNDAIAIYLNDATLAGAFVARWCAGYKIESADGAFSDTRGRRRRALPSLHKTDGPDDTLRPAHT